ncbi:DUF6973 domain-containing protein, partial [Antrihabitans spumae]
KTQSETDQAGTSARRKIWVNSSIVGNEIVFSFSLGASPSFPVDAFRFSASWPDSQIDPWLREFEGYAACVYTLGGDRDDVYTPNRPEPVACQRAAEAATNASNVAQDLYGQLDANGDEWLDGEEDAMRHCTWNAFMAQDSLVGPDWARSISSLHERRNPNELDTASMDKDNNEYGVLLFETGNASDATEAVQSCQNAVEDNSLTILNPNPS